jgi:hypothetical protein
MVNATGGATSLAGTPQSHHTLQVSTMRKRIERAPEASEPVGIVISQGRSADVVPRFSAFEWGPAPEMDAEDATTATKAA